MQKYSKPKWEDLPDKILGMAKNKNFTCDQAVISIFNEDEIIFDETKLTISELKKLEVFMKSRGYVKE